MEFDSTGVEAGTIEGLTAAVPQPPVDTAPPAAFEPTAIEPPAAEAEAAEAMPLIEVEKEADALLVPALDLGGFGGDGGAAAKASRASDTLSSASVGTPIAPARATRAAALRLCAPRNAARARSRALWSWARSTLLAWDVVRDLLLSLTALRTDFIMPEGGRARTFGFGKPGNKKRRPREGPPQRGVMSRQAYKRQAP